MKAGIASILLAAFCSVTPAFAQDKSADPAALALARDILVLSHATDNVKLGMELATPLMVEQLKRDKADIPDEVIAKFTIELRAEMESSLPQLLDMEATVLTQHYSLQELSGLKAFYQTDLGRKVIEQSPLIAKEVLPLARAWGFSSGQQAMKTVIEKLRAQGIKI